MTDIQDRVAPNKRIGDDMEEIEKHSSSDSDGCVKSETHDLPKKDLEPNIKDNLDLNNNQEDILQYYATYKSPDEESKDVSEESRSIADQDSESDSSINNDPYSPKATTDHDSDDCHSKADAMFVCETCVFVQVRVPATMSCKDCEEVYCDKCTNVHKTQKATRTHTLREHRDLPEKSVCEPCRYNGQDNKEAVCLCIDCDEVQCNDCKSVHAKQKITRGHTLILPTCSANKLCRICWISGKQSMPEKYCKICSIKVCALCARAHRQDPSTQGHKLLDLNLTCAKTEPVSTQMNDQNTMLADVARQGYSGAMVVQKTELSAKDAIKPGKPSVVGHVNVDTVGLVWEPPKQLYNNHSFQLRFKEASGPSKWKFCPELATSCSVTFNNLKSDTSYVFQVRMVNDEEEGPYSELSDTVATIQSAAHHLMDFMYDVAMPDVNIAVKKIPLQEKHETRNEKAKSRKLVIGNACKTYLRERTILLVGATGTGKSTLVDGMFNFILGVNWNDPYRLKLVDLVDEERNRGADQAVSQTQWITCYTINPIKGSRLSYAVNIIDTPGFGDTRGIDRDKEIIEQIRTLFSSEDQTGVLSIDAVCFLVKAPDARLTPTQMYIFNSIMSLFGQDIENNFSMIVTFADGKRPPVLSALQAAKLPHEQYFPFNNSGLFAENVGENVSCFSSMFWEMGCKSFQLFFDELQRMETKSLRQTRDVLKQREVLEVTIENLLPKLDAGLSKVEEMRIEIKILKDYKTQIEENSDFTYTVAETEQKQVDLPKGKHVTNCLSCHTTCHKNCCISHDEDKRSCSAMDRSGYCRQCSDNCYWKMHRNTPYIFEYITVQRTRTYTEKLEKYRRAEGEKMTRQKVIERMYDEVYDLEDDIMHLMDKINECNNVLRQIALRPDPLTFVEHIDLLIESEKLEKRPGFKARITSLKKCRKKATVGDCVKRFRTSFTDTTMKIISGQADEPGQSSKHKQKRGKFNFFKPVADFFQSNK